MATSIIKKVADSMAMDVATLKRISKAAPFKYKQYTIPKRNDKGVRWIAQPTRHIKICQRQVTKELSNYLKVSDSATAYIKGRNIAYNARKHCGNKYLLKMDFSNFFNSIKPWMLFMIIEKEGIELSAADKSFLENMLFYCPEKYSQLCLSVGAPSSPFISNFIMKPFDEAVCSLCEKNKIAYTRYADDITFSTNKREFPNEIAVRIKNSVDWIVGKELSREVKKFGFSINDKKTRMQFKNSRQTVTGLVTNEKINVEYNSVRKWRAKCNNYFKKGRFFNSGQRGV